MMTPRIRLAVLAVVVLCLLLIARQVRRRQMRASYLLIWTGLSVITIPLIAFPSALDAVSNFLGIYYPPATIFLAATVILFLISIHFSRQITRLEERTRILAEELSLMRLAHPTGTEADRVDAQSIDVPGSGEVVAASRR